MESRVNVASRGKRGAGDVIMLRLNAYINEVLELHVSSGLANEPCA